MTAAEVLLKVKTEEDATTKFKLIKNSINSTEEELRQLQRIAEGLTIDPKISAEEAKQKIKALKADVRDLKAEEKLLREEQKELNQALKDSEQAAFLASEKYTKLSSALSGVSSTAQGIGNTLKSIATGGIDVGKSLVDAAAQSETFNTAMKTAFQKEEGAEALLDQLKQIANETPFVTSEVIEAGIKLKAYGETADEIPAVLTRIGDMASGMGKSLNQATEAYNDAQTGELERLKEFGITKAMIDAQVKGALSETKDKTEQVALIMQGLNEIMVERFAGGMEKASQDFTGKLSTLEGEVEDLKSKLGEELLPVMKDIVDVEISIVQGLKNISPEAKILALSLGGVVTAGALIGSAFAGIVAVGASVLASIVSIAGAIAANTVAMGALTAATGVWVAVMGTAAKVAASLTLALAGPAFLIAIGVAIEEVTRRTIAWQQATADLQSLDLETSTQRHANALKQVQEILPDITNGTQAYNAIQKEGIDNLLQEEEGRKKVLAVLKLLAEEQIALTDKRAEEKKVLDELRDSGASKAEIDAQQKIIDAIDGQIAGIRGYKDEINNATTEVEEHKRAIDSISWGTAIKDDKLKEIIQDIERLGKLDTLSSKEQEINSLISLFGQFQLSQEQQIDVEAKLQDELSKHWKLYEEGLKTSLKSREITNQEFYELSLQYADNYYSKLQYNEGLRVEIVTNANKGILENEQKLYDARLQMQLDNAKNTKDTFQDDADVEFAIRIEAINKEAEEYRNLGATVEEVENWKKGMIADAQNSISAKYTEEAQKRKGIIQDVADFEVQTQYESIENITRGRELLMEYQGLQSEGTGALQEQLLILQQQKSELRAEAEEYLSLIAKGEQLGSTALDIVDTYVKTNKTIDETNLKLKEKNSLISEEKLKLEENFKLYLDIQVLQGQITQAEADRQLANFLGQQNEALQEQVDLIMEQISLYGVGSISEEQEKILRAWKEGKEEIRGINDELKTSSNETDNLNNKLQTTDNSLNKTADSSQRLSSGLKQAGDNMSNLASQAEKVSNQMQQLGNIKAAENPFGSSMGNFMSVEEAFSTGAGAGGGGFTGANLRPGQTADYTGAYYEGQANQPLDLYSSPAIWNSVGMVDENMNYTGHVDGSGQTLGTPIQPAAFNSTHPTTNNTTSNSSAVTNNNQTTNVYIDGVQMQNNPQVSEATGNYLNSVVWNY